MVCIPPKIEQLEPKTDGLVQMIFLFLGGPYSQVKGVVILWGCICRAHELIVMLNGWMSMSREAVQLL